MTVPRRALPAAVLATVVAALASAAPVGADSFTPVRMQVTVSPVARLGQALAVSVQVSADAGVLDTRSAPLRVRVKLAGECGGEFPDTPGDVLVDARLNPQPSTGQPYSGSAAGSGTPTALGTQTLCVFLEEEGDNRQFASETDLQVDVVRSCTAAPATAQINRARIALATARKQLAQARKRLAAARRRLRHAHGRKARRRARRVVNARRHTVIVRTAAVRRDQLAATVLQQACVAEAPR